MNVPNRKEKKIKKDLWSSFANIGSHELNKILTKIILKYKLTDYFIGLFFFSIQLLYESGAASDSLFESSI